MLKRIFADRGPVAARLALPVRAGVLLLALGVGATMIGCDEENVGPPPPPPPPPASFYPDTADKLIGNFKTAYYGMNYEKYQDVLHQNFRFLFKPEDAVGIPSDVLDRDGELTIAYNMFSGEPRPQPDGPPEAGIWRITISPLNRKTDWSPVAPSDLNFYEPEDAEHGRHASIKATYEVQMLIERDQGSQLQVAGDAVFFVAARDSLVAGVVKPYYQLRGHQDLTRGTGGKLASADNPVTSWGTVKILYGSLR